MEAEERKTAMSHDEMQDYWKTLCSFTGEDIPNEVNQLMEKIHYRQRARGYLCTGLYRCATCGIYL